MKKKNNLAFIIFVTVIVTMAACFTLQYLQSKNDHIIGETVSETGTDGLHHTYVYLGASSKTYETECSPNKMGIFLETFEDVSDLAEFIDGNSFPYKAEYFATTSATDPVRYMLKTDTGSTFWVEP